MQGAKCASIEQRMRSQRFLLRFLALPLRLKWRLAQSLLFLALASLAVKCLPFRQVMGLAGIIPKISRRRSAPAALIEETRWALEAAARRVPWRAVCFQQGLAFHLMLRLRGIPSILHYGVKQSAEKGLEAHVWVTNGADPVIGVEAAAGFACLASVPATGP